MRLCWQVFLEDAGFDWKVLGPDVSDPDYIAWVCDQDAYACSGQKCSAQSILFQHSNWVSAGAHLSSFLHCHFLCYLLSMQSLFPKYEPLCILHDLRHCVILWVPDQDGGCASAAHMLSRAMKDLRHGSIGDHWILCPSVRSTGLLATCSMPDISR